MRNRSLFSSSLIVIVFLLLVIAIGIGSFMLGQQDLGPLSPEFVAQESSSGAPFPLIVTNTPTPTGTPTPTVEPTPTATPVTVLNKVTGLGRLETTEFAMQTMIDLANEPTSLWDDLFGTDQITLVAEGEVVAGVDLSDLDEGNVKLEGKKVTLILPDPEIFHTRVDNEKTFVYQRQTGLFMKPDVDIESRARESAEATLTEWAIQRGIHEKAAESARLRLENLLLLLGFTDITIEFEGDSL